MSDPVSAPVGTAYERAVAALARAPRRPRLVIFLPENMLFRGELVGAAAEVDAYDEAVSRSAVSPHSPSRGGLWGGWTGTLRASAAGFNAKGVLPPSPTPLPPNPPQAQVVTALHAATDIALALIARTDAPAATARALSRARIDHAFSTTRYLPPRLPSRAAAAAALVTALHDVRGATGVALSDALLLDDGTLGAVEVAALGVTLHQVEGLDGLVAADLAAALDAYADNADAARGF